MKRLKKKNERVKKVNMSIKNSLKELRSVLKSIISREINISSEHFEESFDYKKMEQGYWIKRLHQSLEKVENLLMSEKALNASFVKKFKEVKKKIEKNELEKAIKALDEIISACPRSESKKVKEEFVLPFVPYVIYDEIKTCFDEMLRCYENNCYRSALILCGRILEIALHQKYYEVTKVNLLEKAPDIGLGRLVERLRNKNIVLDPAISNQIHLINQLRIASVHKRKEPFVPTKQQTKAAILYTLDILKKLFG